MGSCAVVMGNDAEEGIGVVRMGSGAVVMGIDAEEEIGVAVMGIYVGGAHEVGSFVGRALAIDGAGMGTGHAHTLAGGSFVGRAREIGGAGMGNDAVVGFCVVGSFVVGFCVGGTAVVVGGSWGGEGGIVVA